MRIEDAVALIGSAVTDAGSHWADLGAGRGLFTRALAQLLGADARILAADHEPSAIAELTKWATTESPSVTVKHLDFTQGIAERELDGILLANALHFSQDAAGVLARLTDSLRPGGRMVLVEYDRKSANRWVPYPIGIAQLPALARAAGLLPFRVMESRPSNYEGIIYSALAVKGAASGD